VATRTDAAKALGTIAFRATNAAALAPAVPALRKALGDGSHRVRCHAAMALLGIGSLLGDDSLLKEAFRTLMAALPEADLAWGTQALHQFGLAQRPCDQAALAQVVTMAVELLSAHDRSIRLWALAVLNQMDTPEAKAAVEAHRRR